MINFNIYTQKIIFKTSIYTHIKVSPQIVVCIQDKHLMIVYTYYFLIQFVIRIYTFLKEWSDCQDQYQQLGIIWVNSNYKKAKTPSHIFYEYQNHTIPLLSGVIVWNFLVSTQLLKFVKIYLLKSLSKIKPIVNHRYPTIFYGIIFIQIFMITAPFLEIMISKFQKLLLFPILEPTSKLVYKNFLGILAVGILLDLFCDCLFKIIKILEYRASRFYTISEKISLVNLIVSLTIIFSLILAMFIYSSIIPDILYLEFFWNVPTYRILLVTSIFFFKHSFVQGFGQCWFFSNTSNLFNCFQKPILNRPWVIFGQCLILLNILFAISKTRQFSSLVNSLNSEVLWVDNQLIKEQCRVDDPKSNIIKEYINLQF